MPRRGLALFLALSTLRVLSCGGDDPSWGSGGDRPPLIVSAATSLKTAFTAYGESFGDAEARFSFAGSDELAAQIRQGLKPDVFASGNMNLPDQLHAAGLVEQPVVFAANRLVLAVPKDSPIHALQDVAAPGAKLAIGSASVPIGAYTRQVLAGLPAATSRRILANV